MDMSKLPHLSQTKKGEAPASLVDAPPLPPPDPSAIAARFDREDRGAMRASVGAEVWISIAVGVILLLMFRRLPQYLSSVMFGTFFAPYANADGTIVPYTSTPDFWSDLGVTSFAIILIIEGLALAMARKRSVVWAALALTCLVTAYNLGYLVLTLRNGLAMISAFAVAFGVYIALQQWNLLKLTEPSAQPAHAPDEYTGAYKGPDRGEDDQGSGGG